MSTEPLECASEAGTPSTEPQNREHGNDNANGDVVDLPYRISVEHCYSRLVPFRSSPPPGSLSRNASFPTCVLFESCIKDKSKLRALNRKWSGYQRKQKTNTSNVTKSVTNRFHESSSDTESGEDEDLPVDVVSVDPAPDLPYDEKKVSSIMIECSRHINLVKIPAENSDLLLSRAIQDSNYHRSSLLRRLVEILEADHLARLACANMPHEPIKRRLNTDKAARQFRKALVDVRWDVKLTRFCHETLLQALNGDLLPIYLDILQVLKAKCPVLVENMVHSSMGLVGNEAFGLLLKRPWNPVVGLNTVEKQVKFDSAPLFIVLPFSTTGLGGRRMRMLQTHLSMFGKVYPVMVPEKLTEQAHGSSLEDTADFIISASIARVQELTAQHPARPIVLIAFSIAGRIAAKVAELESVSCIVSLGLPVQGVESEWSVNFDPFLECKTPTVFVIGSETNVCSMQYMEELRSKMNCATALIITGGGDGLMRMSAEDKHAETVCQSIVDRCVLDEVYKFIVYILPSSYPDEHSRLTRRRKGSHTDDIGSAFLTPAVALSPIRLSSPTEDLPVDSKNANLNNSNPLQRAYMKCGGRVSPAIGNRSSTPSPTSLLGKRSNAETQAAKKKGYLPQVGRARSKSTTGTPKKRLNSLRARAISSDQADHSSPPGNSSNLTGSALALNSSGNNSNFSPPGVLSIPQAHMRPLPITPPRNPFAEDSTSLKLDPKTLKQLQKGTSR